MNPNSSEAETEKTGKPSKKHDLFLVLAVLAAAALLFAGRKLFFPSPLPLSQSAWTGQSL